MHKRKIFGIGWPKTGTTTLGKALAAMGSRHCTQQDSLFRAAINGNLDKIFEVAERFDSFDDWPWLLLFREFDQRFPGSKFILTVRDEEKLAASYVNMRSQKGSEKPIYPEFRRFVYGGDPSPETFKACYRKHVEGVKEYFKDRPDDLLIVDWSKCDGWTELERFTGLSRPVVPFPRANQGKY